MIVEERSARLDPALVDEYLAIAGRRGGPRAIERTVLRTRSRSARDLLAAATASGHQTVDELLAVLRAAREPGSDTSAPRLDPGWAISLARVIGQQNFEQTDLDAAVLLLKELRDQYGASVFTDDVQQTVVDRLWHAGEYALLRSWLPDLRALRPQVRRFLEADLSNPFRPSLHYDDDRERVRGRWQELFNAIVTEHGIEPITVADGAATPFDGLTCEVADLVPDGPLVTVIMPVYQPGPELVTSVRSICNQTWRNLEILVMDDCSPAGHTGVLEECAALDHRVQVHRMERNGGTYLARNAAMDIAQGELVTVQDADDWSHPRRIELQAKVLLANPSTPATRSFCIRVSEDLVFQRPGFVTSQENASSLMFRRQQVLDTIGYFDSARKSADTEFRRRLELATGATVADLQAPLAMVRMASGSLSRADFTPGWHHVSRYIYRLAYDRWHTAISAGADPYLPRLQDSRRFALPQRFEIDQLAVAEHPPHYDVVFLGDWRYGGRAQQSMVDEIAALNRAGYRVGIAHRESYLLMSRRRDALRPEIVDLINAGIVDFVALDQRATVSLLLIRSPDLLQFAPVDQSALDVAQVLVVADRPPHFRDGSARHYCPKTCQATVRATFRSEARWLPQSPMIRSLLEQEIPVDRLLPSAVRGLVDVDAWWVPRHRFRGDRPVLGTRIGPRPRWLPPMSDLLSIDPMDGTVDIRVLSSTDSAADVLGVTDTPMSWVTYGQDEITFRQFVAQLDFYIHFPPAGTSASFDRNVARAIASGCVAILPRMFEPVFGAAAVYADPTEVAALVHSMYEDWTTHKRRVESGIAVLREKFGQASYLDGVAEIIGEPRPRPASESGIGPPSVVPELPETEDPLAVPPGIASTASLIFMIPAHMAHRLIHTLSGLRHDPHLREYPITLVYPREIQSEIEEAKRQFPNLRSVCAEKQSRSGLAEAACAELSEIRTDFVSIANLPKSRDVRRFTRALRREIYRAKRIGVKGNLPVLLWTDLCTPQVVAEYIARVLTVGAVRPGTLADYLGSLTLRAYVPRVEALDPHDGDVEVSAWLAAKFSPNMPRPPWDYRFALIRPGHAPVSSERGRLSKRVDNRGQWSWQNLTARLPVHAAADGNYALAIEIDTSISALRTRRRLRPSNGVLLDARTVTMRTRPGSRDVLRYLLHSAGAGKGTYLTIQAGHGATARQRWNATMVRKDLGTILRRRGTRRTVALRLLRLLTRPFYARKQIWLIGERTDTAQDNGFHLFRHLRETQPGRHVYYVIDRASAHRARIASLGHVVDHSSFRHQLLMLHAEVLANAYSIRYLTPTSWGKANYVQYLAWRIGALRIYLKHGVHLNANAVKRGQSGYDMFLTVMPRESAALRAVSGYDRQIREIGMPRYDGLTPTPPSRSILFMPTWRQYLVPLLSGKPNPGQIPFEGSAYEKFISGLLRSPRLHGLLERHDYRLTLLPHYNMESYFNRSALPVDRISVADTNATSFQDLLRTCDAFITDYSSVHFDVAYLGTPVIYARFDEADYESGHASPSWFDFEQDGYGPVVRTVSETLDALEAVLERGCTMEEVYSARVAESFTYRDRNNSARVVAAIDELARSRRSAIEQS